MTRTEFTLEFARILHADVNALEPETELSCFEEWDSLAYLSAIVLIDDLLGIKLKPEVIVSARTFGDILGALESALQ